MNTLKIISGEYKNRGINTPGGATHPMGERERNALFNMIIDKIKGAVVMDLYAGSGALGIEAISRGAKKILFVEENHVAMRTIVQNCTSLGIPEEKAAFYRGSASAFYKKFTNPSAVVLDPMMAANFAGFPKEYDIILADPPYDNPDYKVINCFTKLLSDDGVLVLSHPDETPDFPGMAILNTHKYAAAHISIYAKN